MTELTTTSWVNARESKTGEWPYEVRIRVGGNIPNPMNGNFEELNDWVKANIHQGFRYQWFLEGEMLRYHALAIDFENNTEAMMFKLRWGGR